jgi:hypothetical protein
VLESNIVVGLISGLTVSFIVMVLGQLWKGMVEPWFEERVYKDLHIEGKWYSLYVNSVDFRQETINLKRHGHTITGTMMCTIGADDGEEYHICGSFRNMLLPLTYEATDKKKTDRGSITLRSTFNGERLVGKIALYETRFDEVETGQVVWFRNKNDVKEQIEYIKSHRDELDAIKEKERKVKREFQDFFKEFAKEFAERKKAEKDKKQEEKEKTIEGESKRIENNG